MPDMLVNLLKLSPLEPLLTQMEQARIVIRRAQPFEVSNVRAFVERNFSIAWADEMAIGFANKPVSVYIAISEGKIVGFAAYECTRRDFFGPTGVVKDKEGQGIGTVLLMASLWGLRELGYVYGVIGRAGPAEFYEKTVGAIVIPGSDPGIYRDLLK